LKRLIEKLQNLRNPFSRIENCFPRYIIITCCTGAISFGVALVLLHSGVPPLAALILSALASGLLNYLAMELWAFPHRSGRLSWKRLSGNALVGCGGFAGRYIVLTLALRYLRVPPPFDYAVPLALAYLASFAIGYLLRSRVVFRHDPTSRRIHRA